MKTFARTLTPLALIVGLAGPLLVLVGAALTHVGLIDSRIGQELMTLRLAWWAAIAGIVLGVPALALAFGDFKRLGLMALIGVVAAGATFGALWRFKTTNGLAPPIHDVSTDWSDPVMLSKGQAADRNTSGALNRAEADPRVPGDVGPPWAGMRVAEVNAKTCPGARPIPHGVDSDRVVATLKRLGVQTTGSAPFRVEGVRKTPLFGLESDIAVRIRPEQTDVRAISRNAASDYGSNCRLVTKVVQALSR